MRYASPPVHFADETLLIRSGLIAIEEPVSGRLERQLGYFGSARYVFFYFDHRADGLVWNDGRSYGFGSGAWRAFAEHIESLAPRYGVTLTQNRSRGQVLLIDRERRIAYFADWSMASDLASSQHAAAPAQERVLNAA